MSLIITAGTRVLHINRKEEEEEEEGQKQVTAMTRQPQPPHAQHREAPTANLQEDVPRSRAVADA
jgi:hypothetical protein